MIIQYYLILILHIKFMVNRHRLGTYLVFIHFFLDPYRFVQVVHQQIRLIVASDGPHVILDGGNVFQVHANMGKWFPLIVERRQCENLPIVINS